MNLRILIPFLGLGILWAGAAEERAFPSPDWEDRPDPLADPRALPGGALTWYGGMYPRSLNGYLDNNAFSYLVSGLLYESLLDIDPITAEYRPGLARRWTISGDLKTFTFEIDPEACWSDGRPVTAEDVRWTFDRVMDPDSLTGPHKVGLQGFAPPEILAPRTVRFRAENVHWRNLGAVGGLTVLPKHAFQDKDFNQVHFTFPVVSGPYRLVQTEENIKIVLRRRATWWRRSRPSTRNILNFETLDFRFFAERENAYEAFLRGELDVYPVYTARIWANETHGERFDRNWILKQRIRNHRPTGFQGFALNMRRPKFADPRVRRALAHALNREKMNRTLMYNQYFLHRSYYEDLYDAEHPCPFPGIAFDKEKARKLLREAGWRADPDTGRLYKDGSPFTITFLSREASLEKFILLYAEDLKDIGIHLDIDRKDASAFGRDLERFDYEMTWMSWGSGLFKDPESLWHSNEADRPGGNNIPGFRNAEVDALIEKQKVLFDIAERNRILRKIDAILVETIPYILLWNIDATRILYWDKFGMPPQVLSKYGNESSILSYWWFDPDTAAELDAAREFKFDLPPRPREIDFDRTFSP